MTDVSETRKFISRTFVFVFGLEREQEEKLVPPGYTCSLKFVTNTSNSNEGTNKTLTKQKKNASTGSEDSPL